MTDDKRKKKRGRSKFFRSCFRSVAAAAAEDGPSSSDKSDGRDDQNGRLERPGLIAVSGGQGKDFIPDVNLVNGNCDADNRDDCCAKRSSSRRRFSRILKAVLFNAKLKKIRKSSSKSSISSDSSLSLLSSEKNGKSFNDGNAYGRECPDMDDSYSRRSNLFSSSSRTTSSAYSTSSRTTSSAYSASSLSSSNSNSRSSSDQKTSSRIDILDFGHPVSSNSSNLKKLNHINSNSSSCFDQKLSSRTDSLHLKSQGSSKSLTLAKPNSINYIPQSLSHQKGLSRLDSHDSRNSVSSNTLILMNPNPDKIMFGGNNWNIRWCLFLLLSLVVLVIWGRIFSIMCTSIWFYFVPCRRIKRVDSVNSMAESVDTDSKHYKKRVIMAGLLERTRNPIR